MFTVEDDVFELFDRHLARTTAPWTAAVMAAFEADLVRVARVAGVEHDASNRSHFLSVRLTDGTVRTYGYCVFPV